MTGHANSNIAAHLPAMARRQPEALAVVIQRSRNGVHQYTEVTAQELEQESNRLAVGLERIGIVRGMRTVLMVKPSIEFFALTFALFKIGAVPVMVDPGMGTKNLKQCLAEAQPQAFIGIPKAHAARVLLGWARDTLTLNVTVGRRLFWAGHTLKQVRADSTEYEPIVPEADETAAILFTSGSTGVPKGAVYTHANFNAQVDALRDHFGVEPGERDLATFPLFALFGPALGMAAVVPDMDASKPITADPRNIIAAIMDYETTNFFASPALIDLVGRHGEAHRVKLPSLRRVISAGAPAEHDSLERFARMLESDIPVIPSYGATEALPITSINHEELLDTSQATATGGGVCIGRPVARAVVRIIGITDGIIADWSEDLCLPPGEIGELCVKGPMVTRSYFNRPDSTESAKIIDQKTGEIYHRMGDTGYEDDVGRLWFCGRKSHRVVLERETLFTVPCERIFNTHPKVRRTALVGVAKASGTVPVLCVELWPSSRSGDQTGRTRLRPSRVNARKPRLRPSFALPMRTRSVIESELMEIGARYSCTKGIRTILFNPNFPVDVRHNAKIFREKLAVWATGRLQ